MLFLIHLDTYVMGQSTAIITIVFVSKRGLSLYVGISRLQTSDNEI